LLTFFKDLLTFSLGCFSSPGSSSPFLISGFLATAATAAFGAVYLAATVALAAGAATLVALL